MRRIEVLFLGLALVGCGMRPVGLQDRPAAPAQALAANLNGLPSGFEQVMNTGFCSASEENWSSGSKGPTYIQDATAPFSPPCIGRTTIPAGASGSYEPTRVERGVNARGVLVHLVPRLSTNFSGHSSGTNKIYFLHYGSCGDFFKARGSGSGTLTAVWEIQCSGNHQFAASKPWPRGTWPDFWIWTDAAAKVVKIWQDGELVVNATNVPFRQNTFPIFQWVSIWGGAGGSAPVTMHIDYDQFGIWTSNSALPADWAPPRGGSAPPPPVTITIAPTSAALKVGEKQLFLTTITNASQFRTFSVTGGVGTISQGTGEFTATTVGTGTVRACAMDAPSVCATANVTVTAAPPPPADVLTLECTPPIPQSGTVMAPVTVSCTARRGTETVTRTVVVTAPPCPTCPPVVPATGEIVIPATIAGAVRDVTLVIRWDGTRWTFTVKP